VQYRESKNDSTDIRPIIEDWIGKPITLYVDEKVTFGVRLQADTNRQYSASEAPTDDPLDNAVDMDRGAHDCLRLLSLRRSTMAPINQKPRALL